MLKEDQSAPLLRLCYTRSSYSEKRVQLVNKRANLCNQPGEYARKCMLISPPKIKWSCLPLPVISHQSNQYKVQIAAVRKHLLQLSVSYEDLATP